MTNSISKSKFENAIIIILLLTFFLTAKDAFSNSIYMLLCLGTSLYFFPIRLFLEKEMQNYSTKNKIIFIVSSFLVSIIIVLSLLSLYIDISSNFKIVVYLFSFFNLIFACYTYLTKDSMKKIYVMHLLMIFMISAILFI